MPMNQMQEYFVHEFVHDYQAGYLSRRDMIRRVLYITGGAATTASLLLAMGCQPNNPAVTATSTAAPRPTGVPAASGSSPATRSSSPSSPPAAVSPAAKPAASPAASAAASPAAGGPRSPLSVPANDPTIDGRDISFPGNGTTILAYEARPRNATGPLPVVLICHENRGLVEHIRDVTRRFAREGYLACALDLLSREGGTAKVADPNQVPAMLSAADPAQQVGDFQAAVAYYRTQNTANADRTGMTGYCFGGGITWRVAVAMADLKAAAPYYGARPPAEDVPKIKAEVLGVYSSDPGDFANRGREELDAELTAAGVKHTFKVYPGTQHAFHNDTGPRYIQDQALAAWRDTLDLFQRTLKV